MTELTDRIETAVIEAIRNQSTNARRRRRRPVTLMAAGAVAFLLTTGIGVAALTGTAIDRLLASDKASGMKPDTTRIDTRVVDSGGLGWTSATYIANNNTVSQTTASDGVDDAFALQVGGANGFVIADNLLNGPLAAITLAIATKNDAAHYALAGTVDGRVERMTVTVSGAEYSARLAGDRLAVPVKIPTSGLTAVGKKRAERMPDRVELRPYLVTFSPNSLRGEKVISPKIDLVLADGSSHREEGFRLCVAESCGAHVMESE